MKEAVEWPAALALADEVSGKMEALEDEVEQPDFSEIIEATIGAS